MFRVKHFVREAEILREDVRTTIENATAKRASMSRKPGRISDDIVVPNVGGFLSRIDLWYYTTASEDSRTLNHFGQIGEANQDELIAENMVKLFVLSETLYIYVLMSPLSRLCWSWTTSLISATPRVDRMKVSKKWQGALKPKGPE